MSWLDMRALQLSQMKISIIGPVDGGLPGRLSVTHRLRLQDMPHRTTVKAKIPGERPVQATIHRYLMTARRFISTYGQEPVYPLRGV